jgi:hypothetical protein
VKKVQETIIEKILEAQGSDDAGNASQVGPNGHANQTKGKPEERSFSGERGLKLYDDIPPP